MSIRVVCTRAVLAVAPFAAVAVAQIPAAADPEVRPRLVVMISIDQFRADYLTRWGDLFDSTADGGEARGFRYLMQHGAWYSDAHHEHFPLFTGPGHAVLVTGAPPGKSGIVGNEWGDRDTGKKVYCVLDRESPIVGLDAADQRAADGMSPRSLRVSTIGDELKMATGGRAKVWGLAIKDRAAVLMAGHLADGAVWFDDRSGRWISSKFYCPEGGLPGWATVACPASEWCARQWTAPVDASALARAWQPQNAHCKGAFGLGRTFPHAVDGDPAGDAAAKAKYYRSYAATPMANEYVLDTAARLIAKEQLGADEVPDFLAINLSSNDYLGHDFGPDSPEVLAMTIETDRALADFLDTVVRQVPGGWERVTIVVTADHGVVPIPEAMQSRFAAGRYDPKLLVAHIKAKLGARVRPEYQQADEDPIAIGRKKGEAPRNWVAWIVESNLYLHAEALTCPLDEAAQIAAEVLRREPGIAAVFTAADILRGRLPPTDLARRVACGFHLPESGDVVFVQEPYWLEKDETYATSHGTPYAYDTSVPILFAGCGVRAPGRYRGRVSTMDIAATLAGELGVLQPSGCEGHVLPHAGR